MADVGLDADLVLDIRQALEQTRRIERALDAATSGVDVRILADTRDVAGAVTTAVDAADGTVVVTGEAAGLTGDVTAAVDSADTDVVVSGDASALTGAVTSAVDQADTEVVVTGEADGITGAVTAAIDAADTTVTVDADARGVAGATDQVGALGDEADRANSSAFGLSLSMKALAGSAVVAGLVSIVNAASELEQAVGGSSAVFGEYEATVARFAAGADEAAGLTEEAARRLTSQIGGLLQGFGFTQDEAAATSVVLAQLGADLAATFGGNPEEAVQALGAALRGEFDPLERFGISLNVTQANLKAVELGLADSTGNVDLNARAQASLALIMERSAQAQGQFAREVNTTAGQLERAKAEAGNMAAEVGATLQPSVNELLAVVRSDLIPVLGELGKQLGPALASALTSLVPAVGSFGQLLAASAPLVEAFATGLEAIPGPVLAALGTFLAMRAALGPLGTVLGPVGRAIASVADNIIKAGGPVKGLQASFAGAAGAINPLTVGLAAAAVGLSIYSAQQAQARARAAELAAQQDTLRDALTSTEGAVQGVTDQLTDMAEAGDTVRANFAGLGNPAVEVAAALRGAGLSAEEFADALADSDQPLDDIIAGMREGGGASLALGQALLTLKEGYEEEAEAALSAGVATEQWTQRQVDAALRASENADGSRNYVAALDQLTTAHEEAEAAVQAQDEALKAHQEALAEVAATAPAVALGLAAITVSGDTSAATLAAFAVAADQAGLSGAGLEAVAAELGASGPALQAALEAVASTINEVRDAGLSALPTVQDMAGSFDTFSLAGFRDELQKGLDSILGFNDNLVLIAEQGGPRLAAVAAELGPQYTGVIAQGIRDGDTEVIAELEALLGNIEGAGVDTEALLTGTIGPNLATATGQMGTLASTAFGEGFVLDPSGKFVEVEDTITARGPGVANRAYEAGVAGATSFGSGFTPAPPAEAGMAAAEEAIGARGPGVANRASEAAAGATSSFDASFNPETPAGAGMSAAETAVTTGGPGVANRAAEAAAAATGGFGTSFKPDPSPGMVQARSTIEGGKGAMRKAADQLAAEGVGGFNAGIGPMGAAGARAAAAAVGAVAGQSGAAYGAGRSVGANLGAGIRDGIDGTVASIAASARNAVQTAVNAAKAAGQIASPSRLFRDEVGRPIAEGIAAGIDAAAPQVADAAAAAVGNAASLAIQVPQVSVPVPVVAPLATVAAAAALGGNAGTSTIIDVGGITIHVPPGTPAEQVTALRGAVTQGMNNVLAQRNVRAVARSF